MMRLRKMLLFSLFLVIIGPGLCGQAFDCSGDFYLILAEGGANSQLFRVEIDPITEDVVFSPVSNFTTGQQLNAIGYRQTDNYIYALNPSTYELNRIAADGLATPLATLFELAGNNDGYFAADITPDGQYMVMLGANGINYHSRELVFVDLSDPSYPITRKTLNASPEIFSTDIAFNPLSGLLYGFDRISNRLITIDPETGEVDTQSFPPSDVADAMGAIFFDAFGRLYGYGDLTGEFEAKTLFKIDTNTGAITKLSGGPTASNKDGCSCPYTVRLEKTVNPEQAFPCTEVEYSFLIANASGTLQSGMDLYDEMPGLFSITEIIRNPFGGILQSGPGGNILWIEDMEVPPGLDSITVRVAIGETALGIYANQATLSGLPASLGEETISDNPRTLQSYDSTLLEIQPLYVDLKNDTIPLCGEASVLLDATTFGATYLWSDGSTDPMLNVEDPGLFWVQVSTPCETIFDSVFFFELDLSLSLGEDLEILQGDSVQLLPDLNPPTGLSLQWTDPLGNSLDCINCEEPWARPLQDVVYTLRAENDFSCVVEDDIAIRVIKVRGIFAPNVFSPDGNGNNDFFFLQGPRDFDFTVLRIFNRWGAQVYEYRNGTVNQERQGWDGTFKNKPMNPDIFVWYAEIKYPDGETEILSGDVLLFR